MPESRKVARPTYQPSPEHPLDVREENDFCRQSTALLKLKERQFNKPPLPLRIAFLDIDSTITRKFDEYSTKEQKQTAVEDQLRLMRLLKDKGFVVVFVTARTEEQLMSQRQFELSKASLARAEPKLQVGADGKRRGAFADGFQNHPDFAGIVDPDIIAGTTGTRILWRQQKGGYLPNMGYERGLADWRSTIEKILADSFKDQKLTFAQIESVQAYHNGETDVYPPNLRIQLQMKTRQDVDLFMQLLQQARVTYKNDRRIRDVLHNTRATHDFNAQTGEYMTYLTPLRSGKARAVESIVEEVVARLYPENITQQEGRKNLEVLIAGDSFPDLRMGLYGGLSTNATFLISSNSQISRAIAASFIEGNEGDLLNVGISSVKKRLHRSRQEGILDFDIPLHGGRRVILGDKVFKGTLGAKAIIEFLNGVAGIAKN